MHTESYSLFCRKELHVCLKSVLPPGEFTKTLSSQHIMTMASSPPNQAVVKRFMYAQHVSSLHVLHNTLLHGYVFIIMPQSSTLHFFLIEVNVSVDNAMLSLTLKCDNPKQTQSFTKLFLRTLVKSLPICLFAHIHAAMITPPFVSISRAFPTNPNLCYSGRPALTFP